MKLSISEWQYCVIVSGFQKLVIFLTKLILLNHLIDEFKYYIWMISLSIDNFGVLILQDQPERAVRMLAKMIKLKIQPDIRTYQQLFSLVGNTNAPYEDGDMLSRVDSAKRIKAIEKDMAKNGVQHSRESMKNLVILCCTLVFLTFYVGI